MTWIQSAHIAFSSSIFSGFRNRRPRLSHFRCAISRLTNFSKCPCPVPVSPVNKKNHPWVPNCKGYVLDGVDIGLVASEGLDTATGSEVPDFCSRIASSRDKESLVRRESQTVRCFRCSIQNKSRRRRTGPIAINEGEREREREKVWCE